MSVLTQVLNDLSARGAPPLPPLAPHLAAAAATPAVPVRRRGLSRRQAIWLATLALAAGASGMLTFMDHRAAREVVRIQPLGGADYAPALPADAQRAASAPRAVPAPVVPATDQGSAAASPPAVPAAVAGPVAAATTAALTGAPATPTVAPARSAPSLQPTATRSNAGGVATPPPSAPTPATAAPTTAQPAADAALLAAVSLPERAAPPAAAARNDGAAAVRRSAASLNDPQSQLARAADLIGRGRASEARLVLTSALQREPNQGTARAALAALLAEAGERHEALATLLEGATLEPARFALPAAKLQNELGDAQGAIATLARVPIEQRDGAYFATKGAIALMAEQAALAAESYQLALRTPQAQPVWLAGLGLALEAAGQREAAHAAFARLEQIPELSTDLRSFARQKLAATR